MIKRAKILKNKQKMLNMIAGVRDDGNVMVRIGRNFYFEVPAICLLCASFLVELPVVVQRLQSRDLTTRLSFESTRGANKGDQTAVLCIIR